MRALLSTRILIEHPIPALPGEDGDADGMGAILHYEGGLHNHPGRKAYMSHLTAKAELDKENQLVGEAMK